MLAAMSTGLNTLRARRYAIKVSPEPSIFLEYEDPDGKRRVRAVKLVNVSPTTDVDRLTRKVIRSFPRRLDTGTVKYEQVRKLVFKLVESIRQQSRNDIKAMAPGKLVAGALAHIYPDGDSDTGPSLQPALSPKVTPGTSMARVLGAENSSLRHSSESRFTTSTASIHDEAPHHAFDGVEELDDILGELDRELDLPASANCSHIQSTGAAYKPCIVEPTRTSDSGIASRTVVGTGFLDADRPNSAPVDRRDHTTKGSRFAQEAEEQLILEVDLPEDLNHVSEVELQMAKAKMEQDFLKNQIRPGQDGYQYDKQVEFKPPTADNEWDDSDDADEEGEG